MCTQHSMKLGGYFSCYIFIKGKKKRTLVIDKRTRVLYLVSVPLYVLNPTFLSGWLAVDKDAEPFLLLERDTKISILPAWEKAFVVFNPEFVRLVRERPGTVRLFHLHFVAWNCSHLELPLYFHQCNDIALPQRHKNWGTPLDIYRWSEEKEQFHIYDHSSLTCIYSHHSPPQHGISELEPAMLFPEWHESHAWAYLLAAWEWKKTLPFRNKTQTVNICIVNCLREQKLQVTNLYFEFGVDQLEIHMCFVMEVLLSLILVAFL